MANKMITFKMRTAMLELTPLKGSAKKKTPESDYENIRVKAFEEISNKLCNSLRT